MENNFYFKNYLEIRRHNKKKTANFDEKEI